MRWQGLAARARELADAKVSDAAARVVKLMKDRFNSAFGKDESGLPRAWRPGDDLHGIARKAKLEAVGVLALLALSRLDPESHNSAASKVRAE